MTTTRTTGTTSTTTTTSTTSPTSTTTTTTLPPRASQLLKVVTILVTETTSITANDASNTKGTLQTINADSLSFGPLAPGEISETKIIYLQVPYAKTIDNIKIALIDTGGITFATDIFGIETKSYLDYHIVPKIYFQGLNEDNDPNNVNNIDVENNDKVTSQYVYLNVSLPLNQYIGSGVIKLKWFFDYG